MGIFDRFKSKPEPVPVAKEEPKKEPAKTKKKTAREIATENKEPWVGVISVDLDPENVGNGAFELDWNEYFVEIGRAHV